MKLVVTFLLLVIACADQHPFTDREFRTLMQTLAAAWSEQDTQKALACFTPDAVYLQPPAEQFFEGTAQLTAYFGAIQPGASMVLHHLWFDEQTQTGVIEFTFGRPTSKTASTGVAVVQINNKKISSWREYFTSGPFDFNEFLDTKNKKWKWHIGNYP